MLQKFITKERIQIIEQAADWVDAVNMAGAPLLQQGLIMPSYLENVIRNINENGPYIILKEGFALPHAQAGEENVKETCMSLLITRQAVKFSDDPADAVKVMILLASVDANAHMGAMVDLVEKLDDDAWLEQLGEAQSIDEAYALLR
ncbi:PTS sugar transporter subunit IIA [Entomospira culicis]|uniref:Ascorbate-specific PTS system EIIA component n=1 Tax=Entomospira culicis TaxID=2719989 RepID=A0A968KVS2_9SPIO|nr:PTS sugar transporter subunit IIA [Entomospira culicis]NIZ19229.1 PTS sugar transporter subunit IIA [Entomospira culicis]NIZ69443.1 PTS sugar transporter subunit IIA [Entomospira culicis]WDI36559.1 PTS sugar transporter subunit IIA [Entomospira culicis]WDI38185.1 PTS sugar transporter subunit IIA [Entomospira culicis]